MIPLSKLCQLKDFAVLRDLMWQYCPWMIASERWPVGSEHRKVWEITQVMRIINQIARVSTSDTELHAGRILGIGAGEEPTSFILTGQGCEVHATDLYVEGGWAVAPQTMLTNPIQHARGQGDVRRLVVQHMDARDLRYPEAWFDGVFCTSSIEHFGEWADIAQAAREMGRVLKPGGVLAIVTEFDIQGRCGRFADNGLVFNEAMIQDCIIGPSGCALMEPLDLTQTDDDRAAVQDLGEAVRLDQQKQPPVLPHTLLSWGEFLFTSVSLALWKAI